MYTLQYLLPYVIFKQSSAVNRLQVNQLSGNFLDKSGEPMNCINYRITTHVQCSLHVCNIIMDSSSSSSVSSQIVSPSTETSLVWKHFGFPVDDKGKIVKDCKVLCKLCNQKIVGVSSAVVSAPCQDGTKVFGSCGDFCSLRVAI